jgi:hypothetical protein
MMGRFLDEKYWLHTWEGLSTTGPSTVVRMGGLSDKTAQAFGTFGGASVTFQGSMDGTNWFNMTNMAGTVATLTGAGAVVLTENPRFLRVNVTSAGGTTNVTVAVGASSMK